MKEKFFSCGFEERFKEEIEWVRKNNTTRKGVWYHDTEHLIGGAAIADKMTFGWSPAINEVSVYTMLLHDFCHAQACPDSENIRITLQEIHKKNWYDVFPVSYGPGVIAGIRFTQYSPDDPYPTPPRRQTSRELFNVVRDADQLYSTVFASPKVLLGLYNEIGVRMGMTQRDFVIRNIDYIKQVKMLHPSGERLKQSYLPRAIKLHEKVLDLLASGKTLEEI